MADSRALCRFEIMLAHVARGIARAAASAGQNSRGAVVFGQRAYHEKVFLGLLDFLIELWLGWFLE